MSARNEVTGALYRGGNVGRLEGAEGDCGYDVTHGWAGYRQWLTVGRVVRKGEHGTACRTVIGDRKAREDVAQDGEQTLTKTGRGVRGFRVFHYDQTVELTVDHQPAADPLAAEVDAIVPQTGERIAERERREAVRGAVARGNAEWAAEAETVSVLSAAAQARKGFGFRRGGAA